MRETKTVTDVYGDQHEILLCDFDNPKKTFIRKTGEHGLTEGCVHRDNIILDTTIGFQVVNAAGDCWEHQSFEVIQKNEDVVKRLISAMSAEPDAGWHSIQIAHGTIEKPSFI